MLRKQQSWAERRGAALFSSEERVDWKETRAATSPAAHWLFAGSLCPGTSSPGEAASLLNLNVLKNWNNYQMAHLRCLQQPQKGEPGRGQTKPYRSTDPGRAMEPHSEKSTVTQRSPPQPQNPDIWARTFRCRHRVFQQVRSLPRSPCPGAHRTWSGLNVLIAESTWSC